MRFTVVRHPSAVDQLAEIWNNTAERTAVSKAADRVDTSLCYDPGNKGVDFYGDRMLVVPPLHITFRVLVDDMRVEVTQVW